MTPATPDPVTGIVPAQPGATPIATLIADVISSLDITAKDETQSALLDFNNAVAAAKENGTVPPASYQAVGVDTDMVTRLMSGNASASDSWANVLTQETITPAPPAVAPVSIPPGFPVGIQSRGSIYEALDEAPLPVFPDGTPFSDSRGSFVKHLIPFLAPGIFQSYWEKTN